MQMNIWKIIYLNCREGINLWLIIAALHTTSAVVNYWLRAHGVLTEYRSGCQLSTDLDVDREYQSRLMIDIWSRILIVLMICNVCNLQFYRCTHKFYKDYKLFDYLWRLQLCLLYVTIEQTVADLFILFLLYSISPCYITPVLFLGTR